MNLTLVLIVVAVTIALFVWALVDIGSRLLQAWRERFLAQLPAVRAQGYDERFVRMWEFYLAYCEGGFRERSIGVSHLQMAKPGWRPADADAA